MPPVGATPIFTVAGPGTEYVISPETLRAVALDPEAMRASATDLARIADDDEHDLRRASKKSVAGFMFAIAGAAESAEVMLRAALRVQETGSSRPFVTSRLRLVQALQELGRAVDAVREAEAALETVQGDGTLTDLKHYVLHHLGKALLEAGETKKAEEALSEALTLRRLEGDEHLIRSTELALDASRHRE